jgi:hypothetical protein
MKSSIARIREHPAVSVVNDYRFASSGLFVGLKPGWRDSKTGCHTIFADSLQAANSALQSLSPCQCSKCTAGPNL